MTTEHSSFNEGQGESTSAPVGGYFRAKPTIPNVGASDPQDQNPTITVPSEPSNNETVVVVPPPVVTPPVITPPVITPPVSPPPTQTTPSVVPKNPFVDQIVDGPQPKEPITTPTTPTNTTTPTTTPTTPTVTPTEPVESDSEIEAVTVESSTSLSDPANATLSPAELAQQREDLQIKIADAAARAAQAQHESDLLQTKIESIQAKNTIEADELVAEIESLKLQSEALNTKIEEYQLEVEDINRLLGIFDRSDASQVNEMNRRIETLKTKKKELENERDDFNKKLDAFEEKRTTYNDIQQEIADLLRSAETQAILDRNTQANELVTAVQAEITAFNNSLDILAGDVSSENIGILFEDGYNPANIEIDDPTRRNLTAEEAAEIREQNNLGVTDQSSLELTAQLEREQVLNTNKIVSNVAPSLGVTDQSSVDLENQLIREGLAEQKAALEAAEIREVNNLGLTDQSSLDAYNANLAIANEDLRRSKIAAIVRSENTLGITDQSSEDLIDALERGSIDPAILANNTLIRSSNAKTPSDIADLTRYETDWKDLVGVKPGESLDFNSLSDSSNFKPDELGFFSYAQAQYLIGLGYEIPSEKIRPPVTGGNNKIEFLEATDFIDQGIVAAEDFLLGIFGASSENYQDTTAQGLASLIEGPKTLLNQSESFADRRDRLAGISYQEAIDAIEMDIAAARPQIERNINVINDPLSSDQDVLLAAQNLNKISEQFQQYTNELEAAQPGITSQIIRLLSPRGPLETAILLAPFAESLGKVAVKVSSLSLDTSRTLLNPGLTERTFRGAQVSSTLPGRQVLLNTTKAVTVDLPESIARLQPRVTAAVENILTRSPEQDLVNIVKLSGQGVAKVPKYTVKAADIALEKTGLVLLNSADSVGNAIVRVDNIITKLPVNTYKVLDYSLENGGVAFLKSVDTAGNVIDTLIINTVKLPQDTARLLSKLVTKEIASPAKIITQSGQRVNIPAKIALDLNKVPRTTLNKINELITNGEIAVIDTVSNAEYLAAGTKAAVGKFTKSQDDYLKTIWENEKYIKNTPQQLDQFVLSTPNRIQKILTNLSGDVRTLKSNIIQDISDLPADLRKASNSRLFPNAYPSRFKNVDFTNLKVPSGGAVDLLEREIIFIGIEEGVATKFVIPKGTNAVKAANIADSLLENGFMPYDVFLKTLPLTTPAINPAIAPNRPQIPFIDPLIIPSEPDEESGEETQEDEKDKNYPALIPSESPLEPLINIPDPEYTQGLDLDTTPLSIPANSEDLLRSRLAEPSLTPIESPGVDISLEDLTDINAIPKQGLAQVPENSLKTDTALDLLTVPELSPVEETKLDEVVIPDFVPFPNPSIKTLPKIGIAIEEPEEEEKRSTSARVDIPENTRLIREVKDTQVIWTLGKIGSRGVTVLETFGPYVISRILVSSGLSSTGKSRLAKLLTKQGKQITNGQDLILTLLALGQITSSEINMILPFEVGVNQRDLTIQI